MTDIPGFGFALPVGLSSIMGGGSKPKIHPIDPLAQAMELRARFESVYGDVHKPYASLGEDPWVGSLVVAKRGLSVLRHNPVMIVWRLLSDSDMQDKAIVESYHRQYCVAERLDCMVVYLEDDGTDVVPSPHARKLLEVYPEPEK